MQKICYKNISMDISYKYRTYINKSRVTIKTPKAGIKQLCLRHRYSHIKASKPSHLAYTDWK